MKFQREPFSDRLFAEMMPLFEAHWKEIAHYQDIPLDPDQTLYKNAFLSGSLRVYTARDEGELVGYAVFFVRANAHYKGSIQAVQDILFLAPKLRGGLQGYRLIKWCDEQLREEGVQVVYHHVKKQHNFGPMLERLGYELVDLIYGRRLD